MKKNYESEVVNRIKAYRDVGIRLAFSLDFHDRNSFVYQDDKIFLTHFPSDMRKWLSTLSREENFLSSKEYFSIFDNIRTEYEDGRTKILLGPKGVQWCSDEILRSIREKADKVSCGVHLHLLETIYQKNYFLDTYGKTAVKYLSELGFLKVGVSCAHSVWITQDDIDILKKNNILIVHNPSSNLRLRSGIAPIKNVLESGVDVSLGTDNLSINDDEDFFSEIRLCANLHNKIGIGEYKTSPREIFKMATISGAKAAKFEKEIGTLSVGKQADIVLIRYEPLQFPYISPNVNIIDALFYRGKSSFVDTVIVDGRIVMENRVFTKVSRDSIVNEIIKELSNSSKTDELIHSEKIKRLLEYIEYFYKRKEISIKKPIYKYNSNDDI
jgi:cytosine/adenosine deaminase-related metal-dependent hydrolase